MSNFDPAFHRIHREKETDFLDHPLILAIDTSSPYASLAVSRGETLLLSLMVSDGRPHSQTLFRHLSQALAMLDLELSAIDLFAVVTGPGSFTGLRVGLAAVQGLLDATHRPCIGVDALDLLALAPGGVGLRLITVSAGRGEMYCGLRELRTGEIPIRVGEDVVGPAARGRADVAARGDGRPVAWVADEESGPENAHIIRIDRGEVNLAAILARWAERFRQARGDAPLRATYIRPSDAEGKII